MPEWWVIPVGGGGVLDGSNSPHSVHDDAASASLALPASHTVHAEARAAEYEPTGQLTHEEAPTELRVPAGQSVQPVAARSL